MGNKQKVPSNRKFTSHIKKICKDNDIEIVFIGRGAEPKCRSTIRTIYIHPIKSSKNYAVALHEIGHILSVQNEMVVHDEYNAWEWAKKNAIYWNSTMSVRSTNAFVSHATCAILKVVC